MKIYLTPPQPSRGLQRIADALTKYAPADVTIVSTEAEAELVVIYAIGRRDAVGWQCHNVLSQNKRYAIVQVALRSTMTPLIRDWLIVWDKAAVVWSYYDLNQAIADDGVVGGLGNFYHAPLGADANVFKPTPSGKLKHLICTTGASRLSESVRECALAAGIVGGHGIHLGSKLRLGDHFDCYYDVSDRVVTELLSDCKFVSGLRRTEGFELPAVEGLLCGARPILFRTPDYLRWYEPWGEFIEETDRQGVVDQLVELFKRGARPVTATERAEAAVRFNWETIISGFYEHLK